jgi:hypothetical protein
MAQLMNTPPSCCGQSIAGHALTDALPSKTFTPVMSSLIRTMPSPLQSPTHCSGAGVAKVGGTVGVGVLVAQTQSTEHRSSRHTRLALSSQVGGVAAGGQVAVTVADAVQPQVTVGVAVVANAVARPTVVNAMTIARCRRWIFAVTSPLSATNRN